MPLNSSGAFLFFIFSALKDLFKFIEFHNFYTLSCYCMTKNYDLYKINFVIFFSYTFLCNKKYRSKHKNTQRFRSFYVKMILLQLTILHKLYYYLNVARETFL